jgi:hypothetical protein
MSRLLRLIFAICLLLSCLLWAQQPPATEPAAQPTITFTLDYPQMEVPHYQITLDSNGNGQYLAQGRSEDTAYAQENTRVNQWGGTATASPESAESTAATSNESNSTGSPSGYQRNFQLSPDLRDQIFSLAHSADYFRGDFEFRKHKVAFAGTKTLEYSAPTIQGKASFNYSQNPYVSKLADIFEGIAFDLQTETRLQRLLRYDRLGLNQELAILEQRAKSGDWVAPQLLTKVLQQIANDRNVMDIARRRAQHLLKVASPANYPR